jgi:hypothetical protein
MIGYRIRQAQEQDSTEITGGLAGSWVVVRSIKEYMWACFRWGNSHRRKKAALLILGLMTLLTLLALGRAALLLLPAREVEIYGTFSQDDLSQIRHLALRHTRGIALGNLRRSIFKPKDIQDALRDLVNCRVFSIDRCCNDEVSVNTGSPRFGFLVLVGSNGNWCVRSRATFPPPLEPVPDADPSQRHPVTISVPMGIRIAWESNAFHYVFTGLETAHLTVGHKMITGVQEEVGTSISSFYGGPLPSEIPLLSPGTTPNAIPVECRITIFETDQPPGYHVEPTMGKFYRVLWTRTFEGPFE